MARPIKNNADYFSHDSQMRNDVKVRALRKKFGLAGYAVWCFLLELLTDADYFRVQFGAIDRELLAIDFDVEVEELEAIVAYCCTIGLLVNEEDTLYSPTLIERLGGVLSKRDTIRAKREEHKSAQTDTNLHNEEFVEVCGTQIHTNSQCADNKVKESKVKESKISLSKSLSLPRESREGGVTAAERERFFEIFFFMNFINPEAEVERFINHYSARGWKPNGSTSPAADREALARSWKPEQQGKHFPDNAMQWLHATYQTAKAVDAERAKVILREVERLQTDGIPASHSLVVHCSERAAQVLAEFRAPTKGKVGVKLTDQAQ